MIQKAYTIRITITPEIPSRQPYEKATQGNIKQFVLSSYKFVVRRCGYGYNTERPVTVDTAIRIDFIPAGAALLLPYTLGSPGSRTPC